MPRRKRGSRSLEPQHEYVKHDFTCYVCGQQNFNNKHADHGGVDENIASFKCRRCNTPFSYIATLPELQIKRINNSKSASGLQSATSAMQDSRQLALGMSWVCKHAVCGRVNNVGNTRCYMCTGLRTDAPPKEDVWLLSESKQFGSFVKQNRARYWSRKADKLNADLQRDLQLRRMDFMMQQQRQKAQTDRERRAKERRDREIQEMVAAQERQELEQKLADEKKARNEKQKAQVRGKVKQNRMADIRNMAHNHGVFNAKSKNSVMRRISKSRLPAMQKLPKVRKAPICVSVSSQRLQSILLRQSFSGSDIIL